MKNWTAKILGVAALLAFSWSADAFAQAWVKPPGSSYVKVTAGTFQSTGAIDEEGNSEEVPFEYQNSSVGIYAELGLTEWLAMSLSTSFYRAVNTVEERTRYINTGPGDLALGLHTPLWVSSPCTSSAGVKASVPLYSGVLERGAEVGGIGVTGADRYTPALGDGSIDIVPGVNFGCGIAPISGWFSLSAAYQLRLRGFGDGFSYGANVGSFVWPGRLALMVMANGVQRFTDDTDRPTKSFVSVGGGTIIKVWGPLSVEASGSYIPAGAFVNTGWSANVGVSFNGAVW